jgi:hypothetical protein
MHLGTDVHFLAARWRHTVILSGGVAPPRSYVDSVSLVPLSSTRLTNRFRRSPSNQEIRVVGPGCRYQTGHHTCRDLARPPPPRHGRIQD